MRPLLIAVTCLAFGCKSNHETERNDSLVEEAKLSARHSELSAPRPILTVRSLKASQAYYRDALGFKLDWDHGDPPDFGSVSRSDSQLFLCQGCQGTPGSWMMIFTRDVDKLHEELVSRKARIKMPPTNMPWGLREMQVEDPDGNVIRFGSAIPED